MQQGVTMVDPSSTYIDFDVQIGPDTVIWPQTVIEGRTVIGSGCRIGPAAQIIDAEIHDKAILRQSVVEQSVIGKAALVGPFAYIRPGCRIGPKVKIGDFVEVKNARIDAETKVPHLSYVGDVDIGSGANPVSYTHLDVYKRQDQGSGQIQPRPDRSPAPARRLP